VPPSTGVHAGRVPLGSPICGERPWSLTPTPERLRLRSVKQVLDNVSAPFAVDVSLLQRVDELAPGQGTATRYAVSIELESRQPQHRAGGLRALLWWLRWLIGASRNQIRACALPPGSFLVGAGREPKDLAEVPVMLGPFALGDPAEPSAALLPAHGTNLRRDHNHTRAAD
jgi:hypothetical protein